MKKLFSFALVALMTGLLLCSCTKSKEEQFIDDLQGFVQKIEAMTPEQIVNGGEETLAPEIKKMTETYGLDANAALDKDAFEKAGLNFSEEQLAEIEKIQKDAEEMMKKKAQELIAPVKEAAEAVGLEGAAEPAPVEEEPTE